MKPTDKPTESAGAHDGLEYLPVKELLHFIHEEDHKVAPAVDHVIPLLSEVVEQTVVRLKQGGRVFYIGAGTSGRLGILDASEILPTYGTDGIFIGIIAGGDGAIRKAVEFAEDNTTQAWKDMNIFSVGDRDVVVGISASGTTPYVLGGLQEARAHNLMTVGITCNPSSRLKDTCDYCLEAITGPEFVRGSTRMKAGTAQKMVLNMFSTAVMIRMGRVKGNMMVDMMLSNNKLKHRGILMIMESAGVDFETAEKALEEYGSVRKALSRFSGE